MALNGIMKFLWLRGQMSSHETSFDLTSQELGSLSEINNSTSEVCGTFLQEKITLKKRITRMVLKQYALSTAKSTSQFAPYRLMRSHEPV
jgi:hypothetical protein